MTEEKLQRVLAIDLGTVRVGLAISDELRLTAQPLVVISRQPQRKLLQQLEQIIKQYNVGEVAVGLPVNLKGEETLSTNDAQHFIELLRKQFPKLKIVPWDERLTTAESEDLLIEAGMRREKRRGVIDKIAAALILKTYLESQRR